MPSLFRVLAALTVLNNPGTEFAPEQAVPSIITQSNTLKSAPAIRQEITSLLECNGTNPCAMSIEDLSSNGIYVPSGSNDNDLTFATASEYAVLARKSSKVTVSMSIALVPIKGVVPPNRIRNFIFKSNTNKTTDQIQQAIRTALQCSDNNPCLITNLDSIQLPVFVAPLFANSSTARSPLPKATKKAPTIHKY